MKYKSITADSVFELMKLVKRFKPLASNHKGLFVNILLALGPIAQIIDDYTSQKEDLINAGIDLKATCLILAANAFLLFEETSTGYEWDTDQFLPLDKELETARSKFPENKDLLFALVEEIGETARCFIDPLHEDRTHEEAIQIACVAIRIAEEIAL